MAKQIFDTISVSFEEVNAHERKCFACADEGLDFFLLSLLVKRRNNGGVLTFQLEYLQEQILTRQIPRASEGQLY